MSQIYENLFFPHDSNNPGYVDSPRDLGKDMTQPW